METSVYLSLTKQFQQLQNDIENFEFQLEEAVDLELDDNFWDGQFIPDATNHTVENTLTKFELVVEDINQLIEPKKTEYREVDNSNHRLEVGNSNKHRVGGWQPDLAGINEYMAYGLFRNNEAVEKKNRVTSTSLVIIKNDQDNIISFDVEREFDYQWGFGRQKGPWFYNVKLIPCRTVENSGKSNFDGLFECTNNEGDNLSLCDTALTIGRVCSGKKVPRDYG